MKKDKLERFREENRKIKEERSKELDIILSENPKTKAYIKRNSSSYWARGAGYTSRRNEAGIFPIDEAVRIVRESAGDSGLHIQLVDTNEELEDLHEQLDRLICDVEIDQGDCSVEILNTLALLHSQLTKELGKELTPSMMLEAAKKDGIKYGT